MGNLNFHPYILERIAEQRMQEEIEAAEAHRARRRLVPARPVARGQLRRRVRGGLSRLGRRVVALGRWLEGFEPPERCSGMSLGR